jgi:hypothetical protein
LTSSTMPVNGKGFCSLEGWCGLTKNKRLRTTASTDDSYLLWIHRDVSWL